MVSSADVLTFHTLIDSNAGTTASVGRVREVFDEDVGAMQRTLALAEAIMPRVEVGE